MVKTKLPRFLLQAYILGVPLWWVLGIDFIMPHLLTAALIYSSLAAHWRFTLSDWLLVGLILTLGASAFVNGFVVQQEALRFVAALNNLSIWICGLIVVQQVRHMIERDEAARQALLQTTFWAFGLLIAVAWSSFVLAYATRNFNLGMPTLFGMTLGGAVPSSTTSASSMNLIQQATRIMFTEADWGLPGVPMPRIQVYASSSTATAALIAVLGTLALLYLRMRGRVWAWAVVSVEVLLILTLAITLTRSVIGGWLIGAVVANLIFGSPWRRITACAAIAGGILFFINADLKGGMDYRGYSTESRFENYIHAVDETVRFNPLLGLGIKPREEGRHIAVGSHSTFVSTFTRGGVLGLGFALGYLVLLPVFRWAAAITDLGK